MPNPVSPSAPARPRELPLGVYLDALASAGVLSSCRADGAFDRALPIAFATDDSRQVVPGTLFACKGAAFKPEYLRSAVAQGAVAYVSAVDYGPQVAGDTPCLLVSDIRVALAVLADTAYGHPSGEVRVCAFTGTKGKTTSAYYLRSILAKHAERAGAHAPALLTGVEYDDGIERGESLLTTPESFTLERRIANAHRAGCEHLVMEASSQAMKFRRTLGVEFTVGAFTNFGEDHISPIEHPTLEDYLQSKLLLFQNCRTAVVNLDMDVAPRVLEAARRCDCVLTYSEKAAEADVFLERYGYEDAGIRAWIRTPRFTRELLVPTPATFNLSNALAAITVAEALGIAAEDMASGLASVHVPGRMEVYPSASGRIVGVVDYAHNGMSLQTLLTDLRKRYPGREIAVAFGATGGKGVDRRETMGEAAGKLADRIVITEDDPGPEDPSVIADAISKAVSAQGNDNWQIVIDRPEAIRTLVRETAGEAVVVVAGKGNDPFMLRHGVREPYEPDGDQLARLIRDL